MTVSTLTLERESIQHVFHQWGAEQESLDTQWNESLAALEAYQSHLDAWQQDLVHEREGLRQAREEWEREQATADQSREQSATQTTAELDAAREQVVQLSRQLRARDEELRAFEQQCSEVAGELEQSRTYSKQLAAERDEQRLQLEQERAAAAEQLQKLQDSRWATAASAADSQPEEGVATVVSQDSTLMPVKLQRKLAGKGGDSKRTANSPVLGSIVEQFGKLRQQRASERQAGKKNG